MKKNLVFWFVISLFAFRVNKNNTPPNAIVIKEALRIGIRSPSPYIAATNTLNCIEKPRNTRINPITFIMDFLCIFI